MLSDSIVQGSGATIQNILDGRVFVKPLNKIMSYGVISDHLAHKPGANHPNASNIRNYVFISTLSDI
jgi:hypothetical protein